MVAGFCKCAAASRFILLSMASCRILHAVAIVTMSFAGMAASAFCEQVSAVGGGNE
jgi:NO-binding membrane sensor protein with MHYT domain